ncbi:glutamate racemase [Paucibacter sp. JuS9]|uniref:glutamate racemase n=1 Tax=Roseateles TaxID=93681 RepID=UPI002FE661C0
MKQAAASPSIGVFDSGLGGLTVLRELRRQMPEVPLHYIADTAHAPYGQRSPDFIQARSLALSEHLQASGAALIVVACNTATAHAIQALRQRWPSLPFVGTEPGIKPAVAVSKAARIGVLATPATITSARYQDLLARHAGQAQVFSQACPGLVDLIEAGDLESPALNALIDQLCAPLREAQVDTVLMGCTHYPLVQKQLQAALGSQVLMLNIETAVAHQAQRLWPHGASGAGMRIETTGDAVAMQRFVQQVLGWQTQTVEPASV